MTANTGNITAAESALLDGGSTPPNKYNYNITDMDKRCIYRMEPEPSAAPTLGQKRVDPVRHLCSGGIGLSESLHDVLGRRK